MVCWYCYIGFFFIEIVWLVFEGKICEWFEEIIWNLIGSDVKGILI